MRLRFTLNKINGKCTQLNTPYELGEWISCAPTVMNLAIYNTQLCSGLFRGTKCVHTKTHTNKSVINN